MRHENFAPGRLGSECGDTDDGRPNLAMAAMIVAWVVTPVVVVAAALSGGGVLGAILALVVAPPVVFAACLALFAGLQVMKRR